ncbi:MAG TPA: flavodoxin domain-containing protein [Tenuifilaceae bacterium]|nr:flavodoxin domain-containing protein [Bacteroidales bacterium]HNS30175.1 flavodoxin domain-containing protein [Tenuifilaceae bacterium]HPX09323.1 flavodoxin domain-containing protein [Tenuifilaceae bacterium]HQC67115.1 flavodoxin domain-containing protein [Tenuifilaceae bacterium]
MKRIILFLAVNLLACISFSQTNVLACYFSQSGKTKQMAEAIAEGALTENGVNVTIKSIDEVTAEDHQWAKAVIVGTPVHNGNIPHQVVAKLLEWDGKNLRNKVGGVFVTAGSISSGEEITQMNLILNLICKGMMVVGGPDFSNPFGVNAVTREEPFGSETIAPQFIKKANAFGMRVVEAAKQLK